jgi:cytochrome c oxidase cbb3-type subunit 3
MKTSIAMWTLVLVAALAAPAASRAATQDAVSREKAVELYAANCQACHGPEGKGSPLMKGSAFVKRQWKHGTTEAEMVQTISEGVKGTMMLPFKEKLKPEEIAGLAALVRSFDPALTKPAKVKK